MEYILDYHLSKHIIPEITYIIRKYIEYKCDGCDNKFVSIEKDEKTLNDFLDLSNPCFYYRKHKLLLEYNLCFLCMNVCISRYTDNVIHYKFTTLSGILEVEKLIFNFTRNNIIMYIYNTTKEIFIPDIKYYTDILDINIANKSITGVIERFTDLK